MRKHLFLVVLALAGSLIVSLFVVILKNNLATVSQNNQENNQELVLGASTLPVAGVTYNLAGSGITSSATSITLQSLTIPQTAYELQDADFSAIFFLTLEPGKNI